MSRPPGGIIFAVEEVPEGGYLARMLGHDIYTEADSSDGVREAVRDAVRCHFDEDDRPKVIRLHFVREESVRHEAAATCRERKLAKARRKLGYRITRRKGSQTPFR